MSLVLAALPRYREQVSGPGRYSYGFYVLVTIPLIPYAIAGFLGGLALLWQRFVGKRTIHGFLHLGFMCETEYQVWRYFLLCVKRAVPFVGCVYNNICLYSFNTFKCEQLRDLTWVMRAAPAVVCYDSNEHRAMIAVSIAALMLYVIGLPAVVLSTVCYARKHDKLKHEDFLQVVGLFYREYGVKNMRPFPNFCV
jgi:hypothetical protein